MLRKKEKIGYERRPFLDQKSVINDYYCIKQKIDNQRHATKKGLETKLQLNTPLTDFLESQRRLSDVTIMLLQSRQQLKAWEEQSKSEWLQLKRRQQELHDSFIDFDGFIRENYEKRKRAMAKIEKEKKMQENRKIEITKLQERIKELKLVENKLDENVKENQKYKQFLLLTLDKSPDMKEVHDILARYHVLTGTSTELVKQQSDALASIQNSRQQLTQAAEKQAQLMTQLYTELADLRVRQDAAQMLTSKWDSVVGYVREFAAAKTLLIHQVRTSCWELYKTISQTKKEPLSIEESDTERQLAYIARRIQELKQVACAAKQKYEAHLPRSDMITATSSVDLLQ